MAIFHSEKKLKNWYIQEHTTTGTTFELKKQKTRYKEVIPTMVETLDKNNQSIVQIYCW